MSSKTIIKKKTGKNKGLYIAISVILVAIIAATIIYYYKLKKSSSTDEYVAPSSPTSSTSTTVAPSSSTQKSVTATLGNNTLLKKGMWGREIRWMQFEYNQQVARPTGRILLEEDGKFGDNTEKVVKKVMGSISTTYTNFKNKLDNLNPITITDPLS